MLDKISVIIPCYNYGKYLSDAIESALAQTYKNIEIIVVDDGSTDNTVEIANKYPVKIFTQNNRGLSATRNFGISKATGQWIFPIDADDKIIENCFEQLLEKAKKENADIVCPGLQEFEGRNRSHRYADKNLTLKGFKITNQVHASCLYKRGIWEDIGGYDENMKEGHEDWDFWARALRKEYKMVAINEPMFFYRIHPDSMIRKVGAFHIKNRDYILNKLKIT